MKIEEVRKKREGRKAKVLVLTIDSSAYGCSGFDSL